jgi:hypothetical protein
MPDKPQVKQGNWRQAHFEFGEEQKTQEENWARRDQQEVPRST